MILIAVALFGALSYAVTRSNRGSGDAKSETITADAARVIQWASSSQALVQRMRLIEGVTENGFGFTVPVDGGNYNCPVTNNSKCQFWQNYAFGRRIAGQTFPAIKLKYFTTSISNVNYSASTPAQSGAVSVRIKGIGEDAKGELALRFVGFTSEFCAEINKQLKLSNVSPIYSDSSTTAYGGGSAPPVFPEPAGTVMIGDSDPSLIGQHMFCTRDPSFFGGTPWQFYIVLIPR